MENILKNSSAFEACEKLYLNEEFADVNFLFGVDDEIEKVPANKANLAVLSPVFRTMFYGSLPEKGDVQITDADADGFKEFLQFFYLGNVTLTIENIETVVRLADKYDILEHIKASAADLKGKLTLDNMCWGYQLGVNLENKELIEFCENQIIRSPKDIFATDVFQRCDKSILTRILDLYLTCNEAEVFDACLIWAKNACKQEGLDDTQATNLKIQLGDCLKQIRFGVMKAEEFKQRNMLNEGLFTIVEFEDIMLSITVNKYRPKIFNKKPRFPWHASEILKCERKTLVVEPRRFIRTSEVTSFSSSHFILLGKFQTAQMHFNRTYSTPIEVIITERENLTFDQNATQKIIYKSTAAGKWGGERNKQLIWTLPYPILIQPQRMYEIQLNIENFGKCWYYSDCKQMVEMEDGIKVQFHRNPILDYDNLSIGWLSEFFFSKTSN